MIALPTSSAFYAQDTSPFQQAGLCVVYLFYQSDTPDSSIGMVCSYFIRQLKLCFFVIVILFTNDGTLRSITIAYKMKRVIVWYLRRVLLACVATFPVGIYMFISVLSETGRGTQDINR